MRVELKERHRLYDGHFRLERILLQFEQYDGGMSPKVERLVFERGDSAAVLLYNAAACTVTLVEQFRLPAYLREGENCRLLEVVAGTVDAERSPESVAKSELLEEAGYAVGKLEHVATFYPSPGAGTERIYLYLASVTPEGRVSAGGGVGPGEDLRVVELPLEEAMHLVASGAIRDGKTIIALQHLWMRVNGARSE